MSWVDALENINYLAVLLGALVSLAIGAAWYAPAVFGNKWAKLVGLKKKDMEDTSGMPVMMATSIIFYGLISLVIGLMISMTGSEGLGEGLVLGAILGFVFSFGPMAVTYGFARRKFELSVVDGGYAVITCAVIGAIIGQLG